MRTIHYKTLRGFMRANGKPDEEFSIYQGSRPMGWEQDDFFKDAVSILNDSYPLIPWMPNKVGMFHTK